MADDGVQNDQADAGTSAGRGGLLVWAAAVVALLVGTAGGVALVGPMAASRMSAEPAEEPVKERPVESYTVESLVLNPAETKGTRFLMATIVFTATVAGGDGSMHEYDPEIRDRLMSLLGSKTVDELTDVGGRDVLKEEIRAAVNEVVSPSEVRTVYLPTFVIQ